MWNCFQIVLCSDSNLCCHESATAVQSRRNSEALPMSFSLQNKATGISQEVLWCISLYKVMTNDDQARRQGKPMPQHHQWRLVSAKLNEDHQRVARWTNATALSIVCWVILTPLPNIVCPLKCLHQQNPTCSSSRQLPEKTPLACSQQNILS